MLIVVSTSPPGGNQVDGLPPAASARSLAQNHGFKVGCSLIVCVVVSLSCHAMCVDFVHAEWFHTMYVAVVHVELCSVVSTSPSGGNLVDGSPPAASDS